jgi:integrase
VSAQAGIPVARAVLLKVALAEYTAEHEAIWSQGWAQAVDGFIAHRVRPFFGDGERIVSTITRADIERFRAGEIGRPGPRGKPTSEPTVNRMMAALAAFGEWCLVAGRNYHTVNPWGKHEPLPEDQAPVPTVEADQLASVLQALEDPPVPLEPHGRRPNRAPWRQIVEFARETGLRKGELGRLARADIDKESRTVYVVSTRARGMTKARKMRALPLSPRAIEILKELPERKDGLVFGPIPDARRAFRRAAKSAGLERVWLHLFRHLFASRLDELGASRAELREAGGWSSTRMVDRYTHARLGRLRTLIDGSQGYAPRTAPTEDKEEGGPESPNRP